jgi:acylphosphatase
MNKHYDISIRGRVQGVGFRYHALSVAEKSGITGLVKNLSDGSVYIEAEGEESALNEFLKWCREGPPHAHVTSVSLIESGLINYSTFSVH